MRHRYLFTIVLSTLVILGTVITAVTSSSKKSKGTATYVGQETCMSSGCHETGTGSNYVDADHYRQTMHYKIHHRPNPQNVVIERWFENDTTLKFYEPRVNTPPGDTLYVDLAKGKTETEYLIQMRTRGQYADSTGFLKVAYNYGGNGWIQRFLLEVNGSYYPAPFQYIFPHYKETSSDTGKVYFLDLARWYSIDGSKNAMVFHDRSTQTFFKESWDKRCVACHVNGFNLETQKINDSTTQWFAQWAGSKKDSASKDINIAIGCESCHGPGSDHAADPHNSEYLNIISPSRWDLTDTSRYWTNRKLEICDQCHNRHSSTGGNHGYPYDDENDMAFRPHDDFLRDFVKDTVTGASYWDDGETSIAHHQSGQDYWRSGHFSGHVFPNGCFDCHEAHKTTEYPYQLNRNWYSLTKGEGCLSTGCHASFGTTETKDDKVYNVHTKHLEENSQCVNCHYTKTATITFGGTYEFSDHSDKVIRPTVTRKYRNKGFIGAPNTCAMSCHRNGYGERNRLDAFDNHVAWKFSTGGTPMVAPDYDIKDLLIGDWREQSDLALADSLWEGYKLLYPEYVSSVRVADAPSSGAAAITSLTPDPSRADVRISFILPTRANIRLEVYDARGNLVRTVAESTEDAGSYEDTWEGIDEFNHPVPSGTYFVRLTGDTFTTTKSVVILR